MGKDLIALLGLNLAVLAVPGVNFVTIARNAVIKGRKPSLMTALGVSTAIMLHVMVTIFFAHALASHNSSFTMIKWIGAAYMAYLGVNFLRSKRDLRGSLANSAQTVGPPGATTSQNASGSGLLDAFKMGFLIDALNPYVCLFYLTAFSSGFGPASIGLKLYYASWIFLVTIGWFALVATLFSLPHIRTRLCSYFTVIERLAGVLMFYFSYKLLA